MVETQVWDELRRDSSGAITLASQRNDWDVRADNFLLPDGTVDIAAHNAYIALTRGITPNTPLWQ